LEGIASENMLEGVTVAMGQFPTFSRVKRLTERKELPMIGLVVTVPILLSLHGGLCAQLVIMRFFSRWGARHICRRQREAKSHTLFFVHVGSRKGLHVCF